VLGSPLVLKRAYKTSALLSLHSTSITIHILESLIKTTIICRGLDRAKKEKPTQPCSSKGSLIEVNSWSKASTLFWLRAVALTSSDLPDLDQKLSLHTRLYHHGLIGAARIQTVQVCRKYL
jgi:hypothetical protein